MKFPDVIEALNLSEREKLIFNLAAIIGVCTENKELEEVIDVTVDQHEAVITSIDKEGTILINCKADGNTTISMGDLARETTVLEMLENTFGS